MPHQKKFRIASLIVGTLRGRSSEVVKTMSRRNMSHCCLQEITWCGASARMIEDKDSHYKIFWVGNEKGTGGVGILLLEEWVENHIRSDRIVIVKLAIGNKIINNNIIMLCTPSRLGQHNSRYFLWSIAGDRHKSGC